MTSESNQIILNTETETKYWYNIIEDQQSVVLKYYTFSDFRIGIIKF